MVVRRSKGAGGPPPTRHQVQEPPTMEHHHRDIRGGTARAAVFGANDGLLSNLSLILGVAGGSHSAAGLVWPVGLFALLSGAVSMALGEYVSMSAQTELLER